MTTAWAILRREYASLFRIPLGWIVIALFLALSGVLFANVIRPGDPATMRPFFGIWWNLLIVVAPAISMRLLSDEIRSGTLEPLLTSPVREAAVVAGKYGAAVAFLLTMLLPSLVYVGILANLSRPDFGPILAGYLGILLLGMLYLSVGLLASSLTSSQSLAFLATLFLLLGLDIGARLGAQFTPTWVPPLLFALSPAPRIDDFAKGIIDTSHIIFFLAASFWFVALSGIVLQSRRWR